MTVASGRAGTFRWDAGRVLVLITLCTAQLIASIDVTVVNVALPAISSGVGLDHADLQWAVSAYQRDGGRRGPGTRAGGSRGGSGQCTRTVGGALGLAGVSAVVASHASAGPDDAIGRGFVVCAALLGVAALCSLGLFRRR